MKRLIAVICSVVMLLSFAVTSNAAEIGFMSESYLNYDATVNYKMELNKPLDFLSMLSEEAGFDVPYFVQELLKSEMSADVVCDVSEDFLKAKVYIAYNVKLPVNISEDLKLGADVKLHMWIDYDFSTEETAKFLMIVKNPVNGEYIYIDIFDEAIVADAPEMKAEMVKMFAELNLKKYVEEVTAAVVKEYEEHAQVTATDDGYTVISFTNESIVDFFVDYIVDVMDTEYMKASLSMNTGAPVTDFTADEMSIAMIKATVKSLGIFADEDAYVIKCKLNENGVMEYAEEAMHVQFNICSLAETFGVSEADMYPLTKANSDVDIKFVANAKYNKIGDAVVEMPVLTEENSVSLIDMVVSTTAPEPGIGNDYYYDEDFFVEYQSEAFWDYARGAMDRGGMYVDIEQFLDSAQWDEDNLTGASVLGEEGSVIITLTSDNFGTVTVTGSIHSDEYMLNSTKLWARKPFKVVEEYDWNTYTGNNKLYVNMDVLNYILAAKVQSITTYITDDYGVELTNPEYYFDIVRPNPAYVAPQEQ